MKIVETVIGYFSYHLSETGKNGSKPLCDCKTTMMHTGIPLSAWGVKSHLGEKWCKECWKIYQGMREK